MKHFTTSTIVHNKEIAPGHFELILKVPKVAQESAPGHFIQIKVTENLNPLLPRPMGLSHIDTKKGTIGVIYKIFGQGTALLAERKEGEEMSIMGPLGNTFWIEKGVKNIALVGGGTGIGPVVLYSQYLAKQKDLTVYGFLGARSKDLLCAEKIFGDNCQRLYFSTDDGTAGHKGVITDILEETCKEFGADQIISVGPTPMMQKCVAIGKKLKIHTEVSLEEHMACGFGICLGCAVKLKDDNYHMMCVDGPVFNGEDVQWEQQKH